jgi:hypothetical protein
MMTSRIKLIVAVCALVLLALVAKHLYQGHLERVSDEAAKRDSYWHGRIEEIAKQREAADRRTDNARKASLDLTRKLAAANAKLAKVRVEPPAGPPPVDEPTLGADLVAGGFKPGVSFRLEPSSLNLDDGRRAWTWMNEAKRVPGLEAYKAAADEVIQRHEGVERGLRLEIIARDGQVAAADAERDAERERRANALRGWDAAERKAKLHKKLGWVYFGAGVLLGAWATN